MALVAVAPGAVEAQEATFAAADAGVYGMEVPLDNACDGDVDVSLDGDVLADETVQACHVLEAVSTTVSSGTVTLRAGNLLSFGDGFTVEAAASLVIEFDGSLDPLAFVQDDSPSSEFLYVAEYRVNLDGATIGTSNEFAHLVARSGSGGIGFEQGFRFVGGMDQVFVRAGEDGGGVQTSADYPVSGGWHTLRVEWTAADKGSTNGVLDLYLDDVLLESLSGLDNDSLDIDSVRWGVVDGIDQTTGGLLLADRFESWNDTTEEAPLIFADGFESGNLCAWDEPFCRPDWLQLTDAEGVPGAQASVPVHIRDVSESLINEQTGLGGEIQGFAFRVDVSPPGAAQNLDFGLAGATGGAVAIAPVVSPGTDSLIVLMNFDQAVDDLALALDKGDPGPKPGGGTQVGTITFDVDAGLTPGEEIAVDLAPLSATVVNQDALLRESGETHELETLSAVVTVVAALPPSTISLDSLEPLGTAASVGIDELDESERSRDEDHEPVHPSILALFPAYGSESVPLNSRITARFTERIERRAGAIRLFDDRGEVPGTVAVSPDGLWLTFVPDAHLRAGMQYEVRFDEVRDRDGHRMPRFSSRFRAGAEEDLVSQMPPRLGLDLAPRAPSPDDPVAIRFARTVDPASLGPRTVRLLHDRTDERIPGAVHLDLDGSTAFFVPKRPLEPGTRYRLELSAGIRMVWMSSPIHATSRARPTL